MSLHKWPYANEIGREEHLECDVLVLGGGLEGCYAAIAAARKGRNVRNWVLPSWIERKPHLF